MLQKITTDVYVCDTTHIDANEDVTYDIFDTALCVSATPRPEWFSCRHNTVPVRETQTYACFSNAADGATRELHADNCICIYSTDAYNYAASVAMAALARAHDWTYETAHESLNQSYPNFFPSVVMDAFAITHIASNGGDIRAAPDDLVQAADAS